MEKQDHRIFPSLRVIVASLVLNSLLAVITIIGIDGSIHHCDREG